MKTFKEIYNYRDGRQINATGQDTGIWGEALGKSKKSKSLKTGN
jgi:hypothetical protein